MNKGINKFPKKNAEDLYNAFLQAPVAICIFRGKDCIIDFANDFYLKLIGRHADIIGTPLFESFPELINQGLKELIEGVIKSGNTFYIHEHEMRISRNTIDEIRFFNCTYQPFREQNGQIMSTIVVFTEITEQVNLRNLSLENQKRLSIDLEDAQSELVFQNEEKGKRAQELGIANIELAFQDDEKEKRAVELSIANIELAFQNDEKEKRAQELGIANIELAFQNGEKEKRAAELLIANYSRILIEASLDPLVTINNEGKITDMNEALTLMTGKTREELVDTNFKNYFTDPEKAHQVYLEVFAKGFVKDYPLTLKDYKLTDVLFNGSVYNDENGNVKGVVIVARDVTDQKRIRKELIEAKIFAEEAQGKAEIATELAVNAVKAKQQFLSNMSHEIRTPMNAIIGFTKVVLKMDLTEKQKEYLSAIKISGDALIVLINDILDLAKVDAGKMSFESTPFKLGVSISAMLHIFETKIQEKNLALITEYDTKIPVVLAGDPVRLHQIIMNLVSNAVKFTSNGSITVKVVLLEENDKKVTIEFAVKDTGIGISNDKMERIFENFQQATSGTSRLYGGTGLGLAIVKQLVEHQNGHISVQSTVGEGSTFSFILDFQKTEAVAEQVVEIIELDTEIKNIKVLVVEDMPLNQLLMKTLLDDFGFERDIAANGKLAIERMKTKTYDIVLMDLQMPEMNGFEATEYIRNVLKSDIPIVALTADVTTIDVAKCKAVGMNDYIAKPFDDRLLYSKIIGLVKKKVPQKMIEIEKVRYTDLSYLIQRTKSDPALMMEMITLYLEQTPPLILTMRKSLQQKDWAMLGNAVHKMIPSFSIVGFNPDFEVIAKQIQEYAKSQQLAYKINDLVTELENACRQACVELKEELVRIKTSKNEEKNT
jgi:PAS domain S-box-containing protein